MNLFNRKFVEDNKEGSAKAPSFDPYGQFKNTGGAFGFRKDNHVVIPGVTSYEEMSLRKVKDYVHVTTGKPCTLSQELINDVYSIYVNQDVKRRPETSNNSVRHKVLDKVYDSLTKVVTTDSSLYTQILTRELSLALQYVDDEIREQQEQNGDEDPKGLESPSGNQGEGDGEGDEGSEGESQGQEGKGDGESDESSSGDSNAKTTGASKGNNGSTRGSIEDISDKALEKAEGMIEKAKTNADQKIKDLESQLGKEAMKDLMDQDPEFLDKIESLKDRLRRVSISKDSIQKVMDKILNESMNYFSKKFNIVEESIFECEECDDLFNLNLLHPVFKNAELMNMCNEIQLYKGKIDLYLDCSGSMDSPESFEGTRMRMTDLSKGIAMVLYRMGLIENLYFFNGGLIPIKNANELSILSFSKSGGTDFNNVIDNIKATGNNSVIITDGYDRCQEHVKQAFWVGIGGTTFNRSDDAFVQYRESKQCVSYNSQTSKFDYCK